MRHFLTILLVSSLLAILNWGCKKNNDCPLEERVQLDVSFYPLMIIQGANSSSMPMTLVYPTDCDGFIYNGTYTLRVANPDEIPGLTFSIDSVGTTWTNNSVPAGGEQDVTLHASPTVVNGVPARPAPGNYKIEIVASFDDPQDEVTRILDVEVLDIGLSLVILEPNRDTQYPEGTRAINLRALVVDTDDGITSIAYRIDSGQWVYEDYRGAVGRVEFEALIEIPTFGDHVVEVEAISLSGGVLVESVPFFLPSGTLTLRDVRWDGGGDGISWDDPLNWDIDRLPNKFDRAIVDLPGTEKIVIESPGFDYKIFEVGAVDINATVYIQGAGLLEIEQEGETSYMRKSLHFDDFGRGGTALGFGLESRGAVIEIGDTLFLGGAQFQSYTPIQANNRRPMIIANHAYDGAGYLERRPFCYITGGLTLRMLGHVNQTRAFRWQFFDQSTTGSPRVELAEGGLWEMVGESIFVQNSNAPEPTEIKIEPHARLSVQRITPNSTFTIQGQIDLDIDGSWTDYPAAPGVDPGDLLIRPNDEILCRVDSFQTGASVSIWGGHWIFDDFAAFPRMRLYHPSLSDTPLVEFSLDAVPDMRHVLIDHGKVRFGPGHLGKVELGNSGVLEFLTHIQVDSLILSGGEFKLGNNDTVSTHLLEWTHGMDQSPPHATGTIRLLPKGSANPSLIDLGPAARQWKTNLVLTDAAQLIWRSGDPVGQRDRRIEVHIDNGAYLEVNNAFPMTWGFLNNGAHAPVFMYNNGTVRKRGGADAEIYGCLINGSNAAFIEESGRLRFDTYQLNCR